MIATLNSEGPPVSVGKLRESDEWLVFHIPKAHLPLSALVKDPSVYPVCEAALGIEITKYALE